MSKEIKEHEHQHIHTEHTENKKLEIRGIKHEP